MPPEAVRFGRRAVLGGGVALALAGCHRSAQVLRVGSQKGGTKAMVLAAGTLSGAAYRVEWSEFPAAQNLLEAIASDAVDVGLVGDAPFQFAYQAGKPIVAVAARGVRNRPADALAVLVPAGSTARSLRDLVGRRLATTRGSIGHYLALRALAAAGLAPDAVQFVFLAPSDASAALHSGAVAAWATWAPYTTLALAGGARVLADGRDLFSVTGFDVASRNAVADKRAILTDFLGREAAALHWAVAHPEAYATMLARETGMPEAITRKVVAVNTFLPEPLDAGLIAAQGQVAATFARAGALGGQRPLAQAFEALSG